MGNLEELRLLYLGGNRFNGAVPAELGQLFNLLELAVDHNELSGEIPPELGNLTQLTDLWMHGNELNGAIPEALLAICDAAGTNCRFDIDQLHSSIDSDGDGISDFDDAFPKDPRKTTDTDGDGLSDDSDPFPNESAIGDMRMFRGNLITMPVAHHLTTQELRTHDYAERFYKSFQDVFDFLMMVSNVENIEDNEVTNYYGIAFAVSNDIAGIGLRDFYDNGYGSGGETQETISFPLLAGHTEWSWSP